ncbi:hypothetical protein [Pantoea trifolii]|uniref:Uncharacterized protein n=1 Tax=Pantoea trifolii TaxID=2968030 RepID=A0ABT1VMD8_9GAMM|nr:MULTISPECIES: hypothetical protein [unclassified Pantoea]MCQ8228704.1 hypothetical protein [Pantoea sp. MMK2]MCQ8236877.1 hypothetical protein [Pantoea sp. MMK3]
MSNIENVNKIESALKAIDDLEILAKSTRPADLNGFCGEYNYKWKNKVDEAVAIVDGPLSPVILKLVPYLPILLSIIKSLQLGVEQSCQVTNAVEHPKSE